jgi:hypothetical protein
MLPLDVPYLRIGRVGRDGGVDLYRRHAVATVVRLLHHHRPMSVARIQPCGHSSSVGCSCCTHHSGEAEVHAPDSVTEVDRQDDLILRSRTGDQPTASAAHTNTRERLRTGPQGAQD